MGVLRSHGAAQIRKPPGPQEKKIVVAPLYLMLMFPTSFVSQSSALIDTIESEKGQGSKEAVRINSHLELLMYLRTTAE